jgi:excisionase family DNA binding protein
MDEPSFLTLVEAALLLRVSARTLETWSRGPNPRIPSVRLGRRVLFERSALEDWIKRHTTA